MSISLISPPTSNQQLLQAYKIPKQPYICFSTSDPPQNEYFANVNPVKVISKLENQMEYQKKKETTLLFETHSQEQKLQRRYNSQLLPFQNSHLKKENNKEVRIHEPQRNNQVQNQFASNQTPQKIISFFSQSQMSMQTPQKINFVKTPIVQSESLRHATNISNIQNEKQGNTNLHIPNDSNIKFFNAGNQFIQEDYQPHQKPSISKEQSSQKRYSTELLNNIGIKMKTTPDLLSNSDQFLKEFTCYSIKQQNLELLNQGKSFNQIDTKVKDKQYLFTKSGANQNPLMVSIPNKSIEINNKCYQNQSNPIQFHNSEYEQENPQLSTQTTQVTSPNSTNLNIAQIKNYNEFSCFQQNKQQNPIIFQKDLKSELLKKMARFRALKSESFRLQRQVEQQRSKLTPSLFYSSFASESSENQSLFLQKQSIPQIQSQSLHSQNISCSQAYQSNSQPYLPSLEQIKNQVENIPTPSESDNLFSLKFYSQYKILKDRIDPNHLANQIPVSLLFKEALEMNIKTQSELTYFIEYAFENPEKYLPKQNQYFLPQNENEIIKSKYLYEIEYL